MLKDNENNNKAHFAEDRVIVGALLNLGGAFVELTLSSNHILHIKKVQTEAQFYIGTQYNKIII